MMETTVPVINARYIRNCSRKTDRPSTYRTVGAVRYIGFGHTFENPKQFQRGQWHSQDGEETHDDVMAWAKENAQQHKYTYTFVLSVRDAAMQDVDFIETVQGAMSDQAKNDFPTDWRMMVHRDSDHDHVHLVLFRDKTLQKAQLAQWRQTLQQELAVREAQRLQEQQEQGIRRERQYHGDLYFG